jgi:hypothetical protein
MTRSRRPQQWMAGAAALLLCAACAGGAEEVRSAGSSSTSPSVSASGDAHHHMAADDPAGQADLRLRMEQVLGHHAVLMIRLMRGPVDNEPTFVAAAQGALDRNTDELVDAVGHAYGDDAGIQFRSLWEEHVRLLRDYSEAVADQDQAGMDKAMSALDAYAGRYGQLIAAATDGELSADAVAAGVAEHIHHMIRATDAYAAGDFPGAFRLQREAYAAMFGTAKSLAGAAVTRANGELPVAFDSPGENLRSGLGQLLGEHVELAFDATRAIVAGQPAAEAAAQALNENTQDILTAMQGAVGDQASAAFGRVWAAHIDALVAFSVGVADDNDEAQAAARARLDHFPGRLSALLAPLSQGNVAAQTVVAALREHDQQLLQQVTAYAAKDYDTSHDLAYAGYDHMFAIATTLADVLGGEAGGTAPGGGADTGAGGAARR